MKQIFWRSHLQARWCRRMFLSSVVMSCLGPFAPRFAHADGIWADCRRSFQDPSTIYGYYQFIQGATVMLDRGTAVGEPFGPWLASSIPNAWRCTPAAQRLNQSYQTTIQAYSPYVRETGLIDHEGVTYGSYRTNDSRVNYIGRWRYWINGESSDWIALTNPAGSYLSPPMQTLIHTETTPYDIGVETQIKLVLRSTTTIRPGSTLPIFDPFYVRPIQADDRSNFSSSNYRITQVRSNSITLMSGGTCTTPDVMVALPTARLSQFSGVGTTATRKAFDLSFHNCPAALGGIAYRFSPTTSVLNTDEGVVALDAQSTARGVGVQFLLGDLEPLQFDTAYALATYDPEARGSYKVPMTTGLYQTETEVTPGTANSAITFTLSYR